MNNSFGELKHLERINEVLEMKIHIDEKNFTAEKNKIVDEKEKQIKDLKKDKYNLEICVADKTDQIYQLETALVKKDTQIKSLELKGTIFTDKLATIQKELDNHKSLSKQRESQQKREKEELERQMHDLQKEITLLRTQTEEDSNRRESLIKEQIEMFNKHRKEFQKEREAWLEERKHFEASRMKQESLIDAERKQHKSEIMVVLKDMKSTMDVVLQQTEQIRRDGAAKIININKVTNAQLSTDDCSNAMSNRGFPAINKRNVQNKAKGPFQATYRPKVPNTFSTFNRQSR